MLLDTSGLFFILDPNDPGHSRASALFRGAFRRITHNYVLAELVALASARRVPRPRALQFMGELRRNPLIRTVFVDEALHDNAFELLNRRKDKAWSLCDAVSFLVMEAQDEIEALTTDHHFEQAGFVRLLTP